jgi:hypothetical protein
MATKFTRGQVRFEVEGELDRRDAEALRLEIIWLAGRYGVEIEDFVVEPAPVGRIRRGVHRLRG